MNNEYFNNFTEELDKHRLDCILNNEAWFERANKTYLCLEDIPKTIIESFRITFRMPGATRGSIKVDKDFIILEVTFYEDVCFEDVKPYGIACYKRSVIDAAHKFVGTKLDLKNGTSRENYFKEVEKC